MPRDHAVDYRSSFVCIIAISMIWMMPAAMVLADEASKLAIPAPAAQSNARKTVKDLFKAEYGQPAAWRSLARKLMAEAEQTQDVTTRYVLLDEAMNLAATAGDGESASTIIDKLAATFAASGPELKMKALTVVSHSAGASTDQVADGFLKLADEAARAGDWKIAGNASSQAETAARTGQEGSALADTRARAHVKHLLLQDQPRFAAAMAKLKSNPNDTDANLSAGRFLCFVADDWEKGLPLLAKGSDPVLAEMAGKEMQQPEDATGQQVRGDAWWEYGQKLKVNDPYKGAVNERAALWYRKSVFKLTGLAKVAVQHRLEALASRSSEVVINKFVFEFQQDARGPLFAPDAAIPDVLTVSAKSGKIRISGTKKVDAVTLYGKLCGWFGKAVLLRIPDARGTLEVSETSDDSGFKYILMFVDKKGAVRPKQLKLTKGVSYAWMISRGETEITLTISTGDESVAAMTMAAADFRCFAFAAAIRGMGSQVELNLVIDDPRQK